jgi:hypothetical protein
MPKRRFDPFDRHFFDGRESFTRIGSGEVGGKAEGLALARETLVAGLDPAEFPGVTVSIPTLTVLGTEVFDAFLLENGLDEVAATEVPADSRVALAFQRGQLPAALVGDLRALVEEVRQPLAIRSSSLLEDATQHPFAGVYATKMIPNNQLDADTRFQRLVEAIKFVWASTFFRRAKDSRRAAHCTDREKMAVIVQEVVGRRHGARFYPDVSGVARSWNFYPTGHGRPEEGVVSLALGLGKTIVDGGACWNYSPHWPRAVPPFGSIRDMLRNTQTRFWAVNMGPPPAYDPIAETEYLVYADLGDAEADGVLHYLASTHDAGSDRLVPGTGPKGPRALTFAPLLVHEVLPVRAVVQRLVDTCEKQLGTNVEIEFALTIESGNPPHGRLGFLQVRPLANASEVVEVPPEQFARPDALVVSEFALGNGTVDTIRDIVYLKPRTFDSHATASMAEEIEKVNHELVDAGRPYLLVGFGRWGTTDARLGVPVAWGQISGARVIVEAFLPGVETEPSQGSHFFHNITSFHVLYFTVGRRETAGIRWDWLDAQPAAAETSFLRHVALERPLRVAVDGRTGRGVVGLPD